ncbi:MAG: UDP-N-acetylglucosamine 2-epimerase (non-hydrolyzing) [Gammaproteobacteria bacterium]|nr:UDP-N-acetylglucosamine 2-epimerase (non-hydrolyzing) [Gammaproteobacteria bacterium]
MASMIHLIAAARPNFMKVAPLYHALKAAPDFEVKLIHTGQHYDANMSDAFFTDLGLPRPDYHLEVGSGTHAQQTGNVMIKYEDVAMNNRPDWTVVVGDVNSTAAVAMVCAKLHIPVVHLEAGLRSGDRSMPEEINRLVTDAISDLLWTPSPDGDVHLAAEGVPAWRVERVGNIMLDSYELMSEKISADTTMGDLGLIEGEYAVVTLHRPSNVDDKETLTLLVDEFEKVSASVALVFPVHPRTRGNMEKFGLLERVKGIKGIRLIDPLGYIQFMNLVKSSALAITDSGGLQEETTYLGLPCLTLRPNTERPATITEGTNKLVKPAHLSAEVAKALAGDWPTGRRPDLWDGKTAARCIESLRACIAVGPTNLQSR